MRAFLRTTSTDGSTSQGIIPTSPIGTAYPRRCSCITRRAQRSRALRRIYIDGSSRPTGDRAGTGRTRHALVCFRGNADGFVIFANANPTHSSQGTLYGSRSLLLSSSAKNGGRSFPLLNWFVCIQRLIRETRCRPQGMRFPLSHDRL